MQNDDTAGFAEMFYGKCKQHGLKVTPQRVAIYEKLTESEKHLSADELYRIVKVKFPNISLDTVNRALLTFARIGLVDIVEGFGSSRRYDSNLRRHHHFHCVKCGAIFDFHSEELDNLNIPKKIRRKFKILGSRIVLSGICDKCGKKGNHRMDKKKLPKRSKR
jgi:Fur family peroxide stress response transcriptional regulator